MATVQTLVTYCITLNYLYFSALYPALLLLHRVFPHPLSLFDNLIASMLICHQHWLTREMIAALLPRAVHVGCWTIAQYAVKSLLILSSSGCVSKHVGLECFNRVHAHSFTGHSTRVEAAAYRSVSCLVL